MINEQMIKQGIDNNVVIYDMYANIGDLTLRLLAIIQIYCQRTYKEGLKEIYVPYLNRLPKDVACVVPGALFGESNDISDIYQKYDGCVPGGKVYMIVCITQSDKVVLGCY
jgi:hypothetical protein